MGCSSRRHKTCHDKSCQRNYNNNPQALAANQTLQLTIQGANVVDSGISIESQPLSYKILKTGIYHISADLSLNATTGGVVTLQAFLDGVPLPCTKKEQTAFGGTNTIHTETDLPFDHCCPDINHSITFQLINTTAVGNVVEFCSGITKLA